MLSIQKGSEIVKNKHVRYTLERFPTDNARVICTKKGIGKYGISLKQLQSQYVLLPVSNANNRDKILYQESFS